VTQFFEGPDSEFDRAALDEESKRKSSIDWKTKYWRPKEGVECIIRILPAKKGSGAKYHLRAGKHFIKHFSDEKTEAFVCNKETYGETCCACDHYEKLISDGKTEEARRYKPRRVGVFNVIDRSNEAAGVKLYEGPVRAVWGVIVGLVASKGRMSNLFDEYAAGGELVRPGRDIVIQYDPRKLPSFMYKVFPLDQSPLGTPEQIQAWLADMVELKAEVLFPPTDENVAFIKTFGSKEEREQLREVMKENRDAETAAEKFNPDREKPQAAAICAEPPDAESGAKRFAPRTMTAQSPQEPQQPAPAKTESAKPSPAPQPSPSGLSADTIAEVRKRIEALKAKTAKKG